MAVSLAVHALAWAAMPMPRGKLIVPEREAPVVEIVELVPFEVEVVTLPEAPMTDAAGDRQQATGNRQRAMPRTQRIAGSRSSDAGGEIAEAGEPDPGAFRMRFPESARPEETDLDTSLSVDTIAAIIEKPSPGLPEETGQLTENKDGTYTKNDSVFVATVNPDGTVRFEDKPNLRVRFALPSRKAIKKQLAKWAEDPWSVGGKTHSEDDEEDTGFVIPIIAGGFDLTDAMERLAGNDPYSSKKLKFLDETREERVEIGRKHRAEQLDKSEWYILDHAERLWARDDYTIAEKRALVFELWDDCAETGDDKLVEAATRARQALINWIAVKLPAGSADAFTADELRKLNRGRHSTAKFAPY